MRKFIDRDLEKMTDAPGVPSLTTLIEQKRATLAVFEVQFTRNGTVTELDNDAEGRIEFKIQGEYDSKVAVTGANAWTQVGSGEETYYRFIYGLINPTIDELLGVDQPIAVTVNAGTDLFTATGSNYAADNRVQFESDDTLPAPLQEGQHYFISAIGLTANDFKVSRTPGGAVLDITDAGTGVHKVVKVSNDVTTYTLMAEVSWTEGGRNYKTQTIDAKIINDVNRDDDKIPDSPAIVYSRSGVRWGTDEPPSNSLGVNDDIYVNTSSGNVYQRASGTYSVVGNFKGQDAGFKYVFNSGTSGAPGTGKFLFDAAFGSANHFHVDETDGSGNAMGTFLTKQDDSTSDEKCLVIARKQAGSAYFAFYITGVLSDPGAYNIFPISPISTNGTISNGDTFEIAFIRTGDKGDTGAGSMTQNYSTTITDANPGSGIFRLDQTTISAVANAYVNNSESGGSSISAWLDSFDDSSSASKGVLIFKGITSPAAFAIFRVTGAVVNASTYRKIPLSYVNSGGSFNDGEEFSLNFFRTGDIGGTGPSGPGYKATSTSSLAVGTGSKTFATQAGLAYSVGARVRATSASAPSNWMEGLVTSYSSTTLILSVDKTSGSGTPSDWNINLSGEPGNDGAGYRATSASSLPIAIVSKTFATQSGLAYTVGARARASSNADGSNFMEGLVTSYSAGSLVILVDFIGGSGTHADWNINLAGDPATALAGTVTVEESGESIDTFTYAASGDPGVFDFIGRNYGAGSWTNPYTAGRLGIDSTDNVTGVDLKASIVDQAASHYSTTTSPDNEITFDLGEGKSLIPNYYSYRYRDDSASFCPTAWKIRGRNDPMDSWTELDSTTGETPAANAYVDRPISTVTAYRYLNFQMQGNNNSSTSHVSISEIEFYGEFHQIAGFSSIDGELALFNGTSGTEIKRSGFVQLAAFATLNFPSTNAGETSDLTITVTGASEGDLVILGVPDGSVLSNSSYTAWVSDDDEVTVRFNNTALVGAQNPASGSFRVMVLHAV